jgi:hypothetical protein
MTIAMNDSHIVSLTQIREFLELNDAVQFESVSKKGVLLIPQQDNLRRWLPSTENIGKSSKEPKDKGPVGNRADPLCLEELL